MHLGISSLIVGTAFAVIFFVWYPYPYFQVIGAWNVVRVLILVDLVLGPLMTLVVYKKNKPRLRCDLSVIATIQLAALVYGVTVIYQERPYFTVFAVDRFQVLAKKDVDLSSIEQEELKAKPLVGPLLVVATLPEDPKEKEKLIFEVVFENKPDLERRPEYWSPYREKRDEVIARAKPLAALPDDEEVSRRVARIVEKQGADKGKLGFVPIIGKERAFALVIDKDTAEPVDFIGVYPWPNQNPEGAVRR